MSLQAFCMSVNQRTHAGRYFHCLGNYNASTGLIGVFCFCYVSGIISKSKVESLLSFSVHDEFVIPYQFHNWYRVVPVGEMHDDVPGIILIQYRILFHRHTDNNCPVILDILRDETDIAGDTFSIVRDVYPPALPCLKSLCPDQCFFPIVLLVRILLQNPLVYLRLLPPLFTVGQKTPLCGT